MPNSIFFSGQTLVKTQAMAHLRVFYIVAVIALAVAYLTVRSQNLQHMPREVAKEYCSTRRFRVEHSMFSGEYRVTVQDPMRKTYQYTYVFPTLASFKLWWTQSEYRDCPIPEEGTVEAFAVEANVAGPTVVASTAFAKVSDVDTNHFKKVNEHWWTRPDQHSPCLVQAVDVSGFSTAPFVDDATWNSKFADVPETQDSLLNYSGKLGAVAGTNPNSGWFDEPATPKTGLSLAASAPSAPNMAMAAAQAPLTNDVNDPRRSDRMPDNSDIAYDRDAKPTKALANAANQNRLPPPLSTAAPGRILPTISA